MEYVAAVWNAVQSSQALQAISAVATVGSAVSQISAGYQQKAQYEFQAAQSRLQGRAQAVKYEQQGISIMKRSLEAQAMARARAAAGGIDPFSGSAKFIQDISAQDAGEEIDLSRENARLAALTGETQAETLRSAGRSTRSRGLLGGFTTVLEGGVKIGKIGGPPRG